MTSIKLITSIGFGLGVPASGVAATGGLFGSTASAASGQTVLGVPMQVIVLLTALTLLPAIVVSITPFLRITVVLHFLRQALGTQTTPSNQVLVGIALFLTFLIMHPVASEIYEKGWAPLQRGEIPMEQALERAGEPLRSFLVKYVREKDVQLMLEISKTPFARHHPAYDNQT